MLLKTLVSIWVFNKMHYFIKVNGEWTITTEELWSEYEDIKVKTDKEDKIEFLKKYPNSSDVKIANKGIDLYF